MKEKCADCGKEKPPFDPRAPMWALVGNLEGPIDIILVCPDCVEKNYKIEDTQ